MFANTARIFCISLLFILISCSSEQNEKPSDNKTSSRLTIIQKPIIFDEERERLSLEYLSQRYNMLQTKATITPKMVVVHWTAIPTFERSFAAFNPSKLPESRVKISSASQLNVSAHYLIDRDGSIYQLLPNTTFGRHVIGLNHSAIGIENVGDGSDVPLTAEQLKSNIALIEHLSKLFPIEYVIGHFEYTYFSKHPLWKEVNPNYLTEKIDPGVEFITKIRSSLSHLSLKKIPQKTDLTNKELINER